MSTSQKIKHEIGAILVATLYFALWIGTLLLIKSLILAEYQISFHGYSMILVGALILSKVVLILEKVPLGSWVTSRPAWVGVLLRTALYALGVLVVLILEKGIEGRHEHGGFGGAVAAGFKGADAAHVWANILCITGALLGWNAAAVIRQQLGRGALLRLFRSPLVTIPAKPANR